MTDPLSDLRRADAHARWRAADALVLRPEAASQLASAPVLFAGWMDDEEDDDGPGYTVTGGVAVVPVRGALMDRASWCWDGYDTITASIEAAHADPSVRAVMLDLDSPGGMVAGLFDAMRAVRAARMRSGKRCIAWVASGAYSAAYGLASTCDEIVTSDTAGTGSIGVIASLTSMAKALKEAGVDVRVVSSGVEKTDGHPALPISDGAEERVTARVQELAAMLFAEVGVGRPALTAEALRALNGGVRYGRASLAAGLTDRISTRAALIAELGAAPVTAPQRATTSAPAGRASRNTMDDTLAATLAAITGAADPSAQIAALNALQKRAAEAETALSRMTEERAAAETRAQAAEQRADGMERASVLEAAKAAGQWTPALDGFLGSLSVAQLRAWRETAPRAVPQGAVHQPEDAPRVTKGAPADVAAAVLKAERDGWNALTGGEKAAITRHDKALSATLRATAR